MGEPFTPLLTTTDWNQEWKALQTARQHYDDPAIWDERAKTFPVKHGSQEGYVSRFLELAGVQHGETVLDMGCGTGALATPLAQAGAHVIACDFSQGMLDAMIDDQEALGVTGVTPQKLSWSDDWEAASLGPDSVDVALASRSIATNDLLDALMRLDRVARRRACITLPFGPSPRVDDSLMLAAGLEARVGQDFLYAFNILAGQGKAPEVAYIASERYDWFESPQEALDRYTTLVTDAARATASPNQLAHVPEQLQRWLEANLIQDEKGFRTRNPRILTWAFIAWDTASA